MRYLSLLPELVVALLAGLAMAAGPRRPARRRSPIPAVVVLGLALALALELSLGSAVSGGPYAQDRLALFGKAATLVAVLLAVAVTDWEADGSAPGGWRRLGLILVGTLGAMAVASSSGLAVLWLGLAVAVAAVATGVALSEARAARGRLLAGAAGLLVLSGAGLLVIFVATGRSDLNAIGRALSGQLAPVSVAIGAVLVAASLSIALLLAAWGPAGRPSGTPAGLGGGFGVVAMAAGLALVKVLGVTTAAFPGWAPALQMGAAIALLTGAFAALSAARLGRVLAWLGTIQLGWFLAALGAHDRHGMGAALFVLASLAVAGAVVPQLIAAAEAGPGLPGLASRHPWQAAALSLSLLSLAGAPPLVGFFADFTAATALARSGALWLVAVALMSSVLGLLAAVRVLRRLFLDAPPEEPRRPATAAAAGFRLPVAAAGLAAIVIAGWGVLANPTFDLALQGAAALGLR